MSNDLPVLHMLCGLAASGKSTLAAELSADADTVLIAEDDWLAALYRDEMTTLADFVRCSAKLRDVMGPHVAALLDAGVSVVLDFQANTVDSRAWMRDIFERTGAEHRLHVLAVDEETCLARLRARNEAGNHAFAASEAQFRQISKHFAPPRPAEGFQIVWHEGAAEANGPGRRG